MQNSYTKQIFVAAAAERLSEEKPPDMRGNAASAMVQHPGRE
jgi:hypothetical protein